MNEIVPYGTVFENNMEIVVPAPIRDTVSQDESEEDVAFQVKYLSMESANAFLACGCWIKGVVGISVNNSLINCPTLVIKSVNSVDDDKRGEAEAEYYQAEYAGFWGTSHTGFLLGHRYKEVVDRINHWLEVTAHLLSHQSNMKYT